MKSICSILNDAASDFPEKPLFVFPETRWRHEETLTYSGLATRAATACRAFSRCATAGERALLLFPTGPAFWEALLGCVAAGVLAVPLKTPNLNRESDHLRLICRDCTPSLVVTDSETADLLRRRGEKHPYLNHLPCITPDHWRESGETCAGRKLSEDSIAFLQYTSGSTSRPKGVQVSHGNLLANLAMIRDRMEIGTSSDSGVTWLPHYHDMGLVGGYLETLFTKNTTWCLPPEEFALRPQRWLQLISTHGASICGGPDFAYRTCVERISEHELEGVDLSSWRVAYIGAERIRAESLRRFAEKFAPFGFRDHALFPCYGLGEATLLAAGGPVSAAPVIRRVSSSALLENRIAPSTCDEDCTELSGSGRTFDGSRVVILDAETGAPAGDDHIGEVMLSGPSVTEGYFNRDDLNAELFRDLTVDGKRERFLQTGDLGFVSGGELFITGRTKELMIVRGRNLYPDDIEEQACAAHEAVAPGGAVAFSIDLRGQESLAVAAELRRTAVRTDCHDSVISSIRERITESFGVNPAEILLLRPSSIPRTSSGKPRRLTVRANFLNGTIRSLIQESQVDQGSDEP